MISKHEVLQMLDGWIEKFGDSCENEAVEVVLMMVRNKIENMPEEPNRKDDLR